MDFFTGGVSLTRSGVATAAMASGTVPAYTIGTTYTMSLSGVYTSASSVNLTASVSDGTSTRTLTFTDNSALSGENFGYRIGKDGSSTVLGVILDDFSLTAVPEPSAFGLLGFSALGLIFSRRR